MFYSGKLGSLTKTLLIANAMTLPFYALEGAWTTPVAVSSTVSDQPDIAVSPLGRAILVWQGYDGNNYIIQASTYGALTGWATPSTLSASGQDAQGPSIGVDASGNATTVWSRFDGWNSIIQAATLPALGSWSSVVNISDSGQNADSAKIAVDPTGVTNNAVAVWHRYNGSNFIMQSSNLPLGGSWTSPASISVSGQDALVPVVAVDTDGNAAAVCSRFDGSNFTSRAANYLTGQTWSSSIVISTPGATASQQSIGMDYTGNSVISWSYYNGTNNVIQASDLHFGDGFTTPVDISITGQNAYIPQVAVDKSGNALILWVANDGTNYTAQASYRPVGGSWSTPVALSSDGGDVANIAVTFDTLGNATALWDRNDGTNSIVQAASLPSGGSWTTPVTISTSGKYAYLPTVGVDSTGNAIGAWLESDGVTPIVVASTHAFGI